MTMEVMNRPSGVKIHERSRVRDYEQERKKSSKPETQMYQSSRKRSWKLKHDKEENKREILKYTEVKGTEVGKKCQKE